jgi:hypothetical protein
MSTEDLAALIKGLTVAEKQFHWAGGSVAAAIWVFRELQKRDSGLSRVVADWILVRTNNPYLPFGSHNRHARSVDEYEAWAECAARIAEKDRLKQKEEAASRAARRALRRADAERRQIEGARASQIRRDFLVDFMAKSPLERLVLIAEDAEHPVDYYPPECADVDPEVLVALDPSARQKLVERISARRRGPWKRLLTKLGPVQ